RAGAPGRLLPARLVVYYVLAMSLFREAGYEEVMRQLTEGLAGVDPDAPSLEVPSSVAISKARQRLGKEPLEALFARVCVPIATASTRGAYYRGRRLVSMDGTVLDVADTPSNLTAFGRHHCGRGEAAFPQIRIVALADCGTHAMFAARIGGSGEGENTIAEPLATACRPGMLVLADRGFGGSYELLGEFAERGCDLVWRVKKNAALAELERLSDGSFRSELPRRADRPARSVRVVEYEIDDPGRPAAEDTTYRLVTTILDPETAPAAELAALYAQRWEFETALDELKTHQRGARIVLRSKTSDGVLQEAWGMLCVHYAIRSLMCRAAEEGEVDPDRLSFTRSMRAARRSVRRTVDDHTTGLSHATAEILHELLPHRRLRANPRVVRRKMSCDNLKRPEHRSWPQPTCTTDEAIRILGA
ncbi:MAG: IS4 family transposase, partial [Acidimicrobiales bacterium]